ncbi:STAS domain-containing protein [Acidobacteria bacterium AB60]|nr:STAS domain-containing protein [Acidobacteria bacterium AB60]
MAPDASPHTLAVTIERFGEKCLLGCAGDLAGSGCSFLVAQVTEALPGSKVIELDLERVEFVDSMGLGTLVRLHRTCKEAGCRLLLVNVNGRIRELLNLTNLHGVFV